MAERDPVKGGPWRRGLRQEDGVGAGRGLVLKGAPEQFFETNNRKEKGWGWGQEKEPRKQVVGRLGLNLLPPSATRSLHL